jgi:hypothetical protein
MDPTLIALQASLNRNAPRKTRAAEVKYVDEGSAVVDDMFKPDPRDKTFTIKRFCAVDPLTNQVLVEFIEPGTEWQPYMYLRWYCPTLRDKASLLRDVETLPSSREGERTTVDSFFDVEPKAYIPKLNDGTEHGKHEHIVYRIYGSNKYGITTLATYGPDVTCFIQRCRDKIWKAGRDEAKLRKVMGMNLEIVDMFNPFAGGEYKFKNFDFQVEAQIPLVVQSKKQRKAAPASPVLNNKKRPLGGKPSPSSALASLPKIPRKQRAEDPVFTFADAMVGMQAVVANEEARVEDAAKALVELMGGRRV